MIKIPHANETIDNLKNGENILIIEKHKLKSTHLEIVYYFYNYIYNYLHFPGHNALKCVTHGIIFKLDLFSPPRTHCSMSTIIW